MQKILKSLLKIFVCLDMMDERYQQQFGSVIFSNGGFYCTQHGATFTTSGVGTNSNGSKGIQAYKTTLTGTSLRIYS